LIGVKKQRKWQMSTSTVTSVLQPAIQKTAEEGFIGEETLWLSPHA
jgi:hypothetical protein